MYIRLKSQVRYTIHEACSCELHAMSMHRVHICIEYRKEVAVPEKLKTMLQWLRRS